MNRILSFLTNGTPWAIEQSALETIIAIAQRENNLEAVLKERGEPLDHTYRVENRNGVALMPINGPLFPRANLFSQISGAYSVEMLAQDLATLKADAEVESLVLMIDSPGGHTTMINEFANQIAAFSKPVVAYVVGQASSAAYWLASAADKIVLDDAALVGSIGVVAALSSKDKDRIEIVSSHAEDKRPDISTEEGRAVVQTIVDDMEAVFIDSVLKFRGMDREQITALRGGVVVGAKAVKMGLADELGSLEHVIQTLQLEHSMNVETLKADHNDVYKAVFDEGVASVDTGQAKTEGTSAERQRITAILNHEAAEGREAQAKALALETDLAPEAAAKVLAVSPKAEKPAAGNQFAQHMQALGNPDVGADNDENGGQDDEKAAMALIIGGKK